jgi:hypothetical protein
MTIMRQLFFLICFCCVSNHLFSQTADLDLVKILQPLQSSQYLYFENKYLYFEGNSSSPEESLDGVFHRNGTQEFIRMGEIEVLKTDGFYVAADHEEKVVSATKEPLANSLNGLLEPNKLQELIETREAQAHYVPGNGSTMAISVTDPYKPNEKLVIYYEPFNWLIKEAHLTTEDPFENPWEQGAKKITIVVTYSNISTAAKPFPHKLNTYVRKAGGVFTASGKCKGYRVM